MDMISFVQSLLYSIKISVHIYVHVELRREDLILIRYQFIFFSAFSVPMEPFSTRRFSSATGGSTLTVAPPRASTASMTRMPPRPRPQDQPPLLRPDMGQAGDKR